MEVRFELQKKGPKRHPYMYPLRPEQFDLPVRCARQGASRRCGLGRGVLRLINSV